MEIVARFSRISPIHTEVIDRLDAARTLVNGIADVESADVSRSIERGV